MTRTTMTLPRIFAVQRGHDAYLFEARRHDDNEPRHWAGGGGIGYDDEYDIRPHSPDTNMQYLVAFVAPSRDRDGGGRCHVFVVEEPEHRRRRNEWEYLNHIIPYRREMSLRWQTIGRAIHLMTSPVPIPLLDVEADLPCTDRNRIRVVPSRPRDLEIWWEHWNPSRLIDRHGGESDSDSEREIRRRQRRHGDTGTVGHRTRRSSGAAGGGTGGAAGRPPAPAPAPAAPAPAAVTPIPKFVADTLIRDAVSRAATCPITMEPLAPETTAVTACFHLFERDAIAAWLVQADNCCAVCKQRTTLTV